MGVRRIVFAPLYLLADWADNNPVSALGAVVALGALAVLVGSTAIGNGTGSAALAVDTATAGYLVETALERPAYLAAVVAGALITLLYDG